METKQQLDVLDKQLAQMNSLQVINRNNLKTVAVPKISVALKPK